jgi:hypothetical protein
VNLLEIFRPAAHPAPTPAEVFARLEAARRQHLPEQSVALVRQLLADPWYGPVLQAAVAEEVAAAGLRRIRG